MTANDIVIGTFFIVTAYILRQYSQEQTRERGEGCLKDSRPSCQYRLRDEGANDKHDERVKRGAVASVFVS